jgi:opacity protein-like surface antigen
MKKICLFSGIVFLLTAFSFSARAQDVEEMLSKYTSDNGKKYLQPFADVFSANINSGLFHNAKLKKMGFQFYLGLETQMAFIPDNKKTFTATTEGDYFPKTTVSGVPTVFGPTDGVKYEHPSSGLVYSFPGGLDMDVVPMVVPQLTIGSVYGTDFTLRYFGFDQNDDIGKIQMFGWGFRHSIDQHLKLPVNLAVGYYQQSFKLGNYLDASTRVINLQTSYSIPIITFYGGIGYESGNVEVGYEYENEQDGSKEDIRFDMKAGNKVRLTLGLGLNFGPVKLHADYNVANQSTLNVGLGIGIGEK